MAFDHQLAGEGDQVAVIEELRLGLENGGVGGAEASCGVVHHRFHLEFGGGQGVFQTRPAFGEGFGLIGNDQGVRGEDVQRADGDAGAGWDGGDGLRRAGRVPAFHRHGGTGRGFFGIGFFLRG